MLTFVNALEVDNWTAPFDAHFVYGREVEAYMLAPLPISYVGKQLMVL